MGEQEIKKTVLVVGAGASTDFGLPSGAELLEDARSLLAVDGLEMASNEAAELVDYLARGRLAHPREIVHSAKTIRRIASVLGSIDLCLRESRIDDLARRLGKWAIALLISKAERERSQLYAGRDTEDELELTQAKDTWLGHLFRMIVDTPNHRDRLQRLDQVSIVTFNYDRLIERYLDLAFGRLMADVRSQSAVGALQIVHVYGTMEKLAFGADFGPQFGWETAKDINTFSEGAIANSQERARALVEEADQIVFLGFAFRAENMDVIRPTVDKRRLITATCHGLSADERTKASDALRAFTNVSAAGLLDVTARDLMKDHAPEFEWCV